MANEAIAAIATPPGRGGIGIVRVSGPRLEALLRTLVNVDVIPRCATRADFLNADGRVIDQGLVLFFPAPNSYTGEDVVEFQGHGGPVVMQLVLNRCLELGARVAQPGEFTRRAFLNDKLDLAQAESVADLINASTAEAARCALRSLQGEFSRRIDSLVQELIELRILVEAALDFPDEDVALIEQANACARLERVRADLAQIFEASRQGSLLREGIHVVLAGLPNVGKSSLMNRLAGADLAIVTATPGTTRDPIRESISIQGVPLHVIDTAGLREPQDEVEKLGISKTWEAISHANLVLWVSDATRPDSGVMDAELAARLPAGLPKLKVINKIDLTGAQPSYQSQTDAGTILLSAKTGAGIDLLQAALLEAAGWGGSYDEGVFMARSRHLHALQAATGHLAQAATRAGELELFAEELRLAQLALASITGEVTADDLLGKIFSHFCIGK